MRLWSFILVLALATGLGVLIRQDPGYAFFSYGNWSVEMPLWLSAVALCFLVIFLVFVLWTVNTVFLSSSRVHYWWHKRKENRARLQTYRGLLELAEGRWQQAERYLSQSAAYSDTPLINYLAAAEAALGSGSIERRDHYLKLALEAGKGPNVAVRLTQAELQLKHGELDQSIQTIEHLHKEVPKHPKVLRLLATLYETNQDWMSLFELLPALRKTNALSKEDLDKLEHRMYPKLLNLYAEKGPRALMTFWEKIPRALQADPEMLQNYVQFLMQQASDDEAEQIIRTALKKNWSEGLVHLYGLTNSSQIKKQLIFAEALLPDHTNNPTLLLALGRLCLRNQLWGKARQYFEQSLALNPSAETYAELAQLMDQLGLIEKRDEYFKKGLLSATQVIPTPPVTFAPLSLSYEDNND